MDSHDQDIFLQLQKRIPSLRQHMKLAPLTYMKIGGPARYFVQTASISELEHAVRAAQDAGMPFRVLGGGANVLIADKGYDGLIIRNITTEASFVGDRVTVSSGYSLTKLASEAARRGLTGLEFAFGIPGTVGGAVYGNAGAFSHEIKDVLVSAKVLFSSGIRELTNTDFGFQYRHSVLKEESNYGVVLEVVFQLQEGDLADIDALQKKRLAYRKEHQPLNKPSLGSVFKNVPVDDFPKELWEKFDMQHHCANGVVPAGYINDRLELRGLRIGKAELSEKHGNFIVNLGGATAENVVMLISVIKQKVRLGCQGLALHEEIQYLGFA